MTRLLAVATLIALVASNEPHTLAQSAAAGTTQNARQRCLPLNGIRIPATSIGLPSNGATVVSASFVGAADAGNTNGEFCKVLGGHAPGTLEAVDINPENNLRRRPMCVYPAWPRYNGAGNLNAASSFSCVTGDMSSQSN